MLVRVVDAELLEAVLLEALEAVDVEQGDGRGGGGGGRCCRCHVVGRGSSSGSARLPFLLLPRLPGRSQPAVDPRHEPVEEARVHCLGQRVAARPGLLGAQRPDDAVAPAARAAAGAAASAAVPPAAGLLPLPPSSSAPSSGGDPPGRQHPLELLCAHPQQRRRRLQSGGGVPGPRDRARLPLLRRVEVDVAEVEHRGQGAPQRPLLPSRAPVPHAHGREGLGDPAELRGVVNAVDPAGAAGEVAEGRRRRQAISGGPCRPRPRRRRQAELLAELVAGAGDELVEDVEVALPRGSRHEPRTLEQAGREPRPGDDKRAASAAAAAAEPFLLLLGVEELDKLSEARRVVVTGGLGVTEGLEDRVGGQDSGLKGRELVPGGGVGGGGGRRGGCSGGGGGGSEGRDLPQRQLRRLRLPGAALSADDDRLRSTGRHHGRVGAGGRLEDVRGEGGQRRRRRRRGRRRGRRRLLLSVPRGNLRGVESLEGLERVDSHQHGPSSGVYLVPLVSDAQCVGDGGLVEEAERADIFRRGGIGRRQVSQSDAPRGVFVAQLHQTVALRACRGLLEEHPERVNVNPGADEDGRALGKSEDVIFATVAAHFVHCN